MTKTITFQDFANEFKAFNRENFTHNGLRALFDYLEEYEEGTGEAVELDVIALCCDYSEYANIEEVKEVYQKIRDMEHLREHTEVIEFDGGIIIQNF